MNNNFNYEVQMILKNAENEMLELHHPYVGTEHLLLSLLKDEKVKNIVKKYKLTYTLFRNELINIVGMANKKSEIVLYTPLLRLVLDTALNISKSEKTSMNSITLLKALLSSDDGIAIRLLLTLNIDIDSLYNELNFESDVLNELGENINSKVSEDTILIGRDKEINNIIEILLRKNKNNPCLIGEAGVGKTAIIYELAKRINEGSVPDKLKNMTIFSIDMASMLSNTKYRGEFETRINKMIKEITNKNDIILFIDEIHTIVKTGGGEGSIDAANILKPYLTNGSIKVIGATTIQEYDKYINKDAALSRRFSKVHVKEPNKEETIDILKGVKDSYSKYHGIPITDDIIEYIVTLSNKYITTNHNPDKSLEVLDCVLSRVTLLNYNNNLDFQCNEFLKNKDYKNAYKIRKRNEIKVITKKDVESVIESITNIRILNQKDYISLIKTLDKKIYGQDLTSLKNVLKSKFINDKVLGFEIRGKKGIGKSYTAKVIAENLNYNLIELDMKEYSSSTSINRLIGSDPGYIGYDDESILEKIKYNPYSLILLKNFEHASSNIINLFKSIIEKGYTKDKKNNIINFNNCMIIMTSELTNNTIGYNENNLNEDSTIITYDLIDKKDIKKYIMDNNMDIELLDKLDNKTNFISLHQVYSQVFSK